MNKEGYALDRSSVSKLIQIIRYDIENSNYSFIKEINLIGSYINVRFQPSFIFNLALNHFLNINLKNEENSHSTILIEHTSINPSGPINVGRIRNSFIGDTLVRIYKELGFNVQTHYYVNDVGKQVAILTTAKQLGVKPDKSLMSKFVQYKNRPDFETFFIYVPANKLYETNESFKKNVEKLLQKCESGDKDSLELLKSTALYCLDGQKKTLERFGITFDAFDFESKFLLSGDVKRITDELKSLKEYVVVDGNHALNLESYGIKSRFGGVVFQRKNGTSVYLVRDIAYHEYKRKLANKLVTVLGEDHKAEFKILKTLLKILGVISDDSELQVVHFAFVGLNGTNLSTRKGVIVPADEVLDDGVEKVKKIIKDRGDSFSDEKLLEVAEAVASSAIRYFELKVAPSKQITFDWDSALNFEGQTGPYLQYALVRAKKIIQKAKAKGFDVDSFNFNQVKVDDESDILLVKKMLQFYSSVEDSARKNAPHIIANYAYELANAFSKFYENNPVITSTVDEVNLAIVIMFRNILSKLLFLLGLKEVDKM